jgi:hypothetical protein
MKRSYASAGTAKVTAQKVTPGDSEVPGRRHELLSVRPQPGQVRGQLRSPAFRSACTGLAAGRPLGFGFAFTRLRAFTGLVVISVVVVQRSSLSGA